MICSNLGMIDFVGIFPYLIIIYSGCHGNHAFVHSQYKNSFKDNVVSHSGGPNEQFGTGEKLSWVGAW